MSYEDKMQEECLECLIEECAEVIQASTKIQRHGLYNHHPTTHVVNKDQLTKELAQLSLWINYTIKIFDIKEQDIEQCIDDKIKELPNFLCYIDIDNIE